jgi:hypothetical protein
MANTVAVNSDWENLTGKTLTVQSELTSKLKTTVVDVTFGAGDTYVSCGVTVDLSLGGRIDTIIEASIISNDKGLLLEYVPAAGGAAATGKIKAYGYINDDAAGVNTTPEAFTELANASAIVNSLAIKIRVVGF